MGVWLVTHLNFTFQLSLRGSIEWHFHVCSVNRGLSWIPNSSSVALEALLITVSPGLDDWQFLALQAWLEFRWYLTFTVRTAWFTWFRQVSGRTSQCLSYQQSTSQWVALGHPHPHRVRQDRAELSVLRADCVSRDGATENPWPCPVVVGTPNPVTAMHWMPLQPVSSPHMVLDVALSGLQTRCVTRIPTRTRQHPKAGLVCAMLPGWRLMLTTNFIP